MPKKHYYQGYRNILHKDTNKIRIVEGVRQGNTISPKLFTATLESIFRKIDLEEKGINIDGEKNE